jgi:hypothetical protein
MTTVKRAGTKKPRKRITFKNWYPQFKQLSENDPDFSKLLHQWAFWGRPTDMLPNLLYTYVCGAPAASEIREAIKKAGGDLAEQMEDLARSIRRFDNGPQGSVFRHTLQELADVKILWKSGRPDEAYANLAYWLSSLALILKAITCGLPFNSSPRPPDRKLIQTRALALLYFYATTKSAYSAALEVATILRPAYQAAGLREDVTHDVVLQRMRRFRHKDPRAFSALKQFVESNGLTSDANILLMLPTFPSS